MSNYNYNKHYKKMDKSKYNEKKTLYYENKNEKKNKTKLSKKEMAKYRYYQSIIDKNIEKNTLKDLSNKIMNIIEEINEKGMNNKRYVNIMNTLMKVHNYNIMSKKQGSNRRITHIVDYYYLYENENGLQIGYETNFDYPLLP